MITIDDVGIYICLKTPEEIRQAIADEVQELNQAEIQARAEYESKMQLIEQKREILEEAWRKTYETD